MSFFGLFRSSSPAVPPQPALPPPPPPKPIPFGTMIKMDLKDYFSNPNKKVMDEPVKAAIYSGAAKIASLFIALIFPFIGYAAFGISMALIDRVIILNLSEYAKRFFEGISLDSIMNLWRQITGAPQPAPAPAPSAAVRA